jgi:DNA-binding transcriptional LysR family regulator
MEFYQLENFIAVVEEHSFTRAAERVFRTQAAVSVAIRKLEAEVGVSLVTRSSHECTLTEAGHVMLIHARRMIELRNAMLQSLEEFTSLGLGHVKIAAHESAAQYLLPAPLAAFHALHPKIKIVTKLCDVQEIAHLVAEREVDLGFGIRQMNLHGLVSEVVYSDPLILVAAPGHRLTQCEIVRIEDLADEPFFMHHLQTLTSGTIQRLFAEHQTRFNVAAELWNFETIKHFVRAGNGLAIIPLSVGQSDLEAGRLVAIPVADLEVTRSIEVLYREQGRLQPAPAALLEILRKFEWRPDTLDEKPVAQPSAEKLAGSAGDPSLRRSRRTWIQKDS